MNLIERARLKAPFSLRTKLIVSFIVIILVGGLGTTFIGTRLVATTLIEQAQRKVKHDLASAWMVYNERLKEIESVVRLTSQRFFLKEGIVLDDKDMLKRALERLRLENDLDILTLTDTKGKVLIRTRSPFTVGDDQSQDEIISLALQNKIIASTQVLPRKELMKEGEKLVIQASMKIILTPKAKPKRKSEETSGMMLKAAAPIVAQDGSLLGVLYGGSLINRNYFIVDRIKEIVFKGEKHKGKDTGTATIFQGDLRISTNVKTEKDQRAIGTRVSEEVGKAVLEDGREWVDRAFVVNHWYITAYQPIKNIKGKIIGILYVGMLEAPYIEIRNKVVLSFFGIALLCLFLVLIMYYFITAGITNPLRDMVVATEKIAQGDLSHEMKVQSRDEIGHLALSFNQMVKNLKNAHQELKEWGKTLEKRVAERTEELRKAQYQLIQSEKLASLGKLAAVVAHEINNPLAGVLTYIKLLLRIMKREPFPLDRITEMGNYLSMMDTEMGRVTRIVKDLLTFSRQSKPEIENANINNILEKSLSLLENKLKLQNIKLHSMLDSTLPLVPCDFSQIQQTLMNIIINGAEAMPQGGELTVKSCHLPEEGFVKIEISDTGTGISEEHITKIFDPFFSTKESGKGVGLGLSIVYGIINEHKGSIVVRSKLGKGATFVVKLPTVVKDERERQKDVSETM
jgi:two-component system NtrC family sensor kinase